MFVGSAVRAWVCVFIYFFVSFFFNLPPVTDRSTRKVAGVAASALSYDTLMVYRLLDSIFCVGKTLDSSVR